ncbi:MAG: hypothetical protein ACI9KE_005038 [Polyangiales bacterium]|jgi:hypothetical protein
MGDGMMNRKLKSVSAGLVVLLAVGLFFAWTSSNAEAQNRQLWYRIVNEGRSAGTMAAWRPLTRTVSATFPFVDDFQVTLQRQDDVALVVIADGRSRLTTSVSCAGEVPDHAILRATRGEVDQARHSASAGARQSTIAVMVRCAASEPAVD